LTNLKTTQILITFLLASSLIGCAGIEEKIVLKTDYVTKDIPLQDRPKPLNLHDVEWYVVTPENIDEFLQRFENEAGTSVFFAISVTDYENMSLNVAELKRYINQQKAIIVYYEDSIGSMEEDLPKDTEEVVQEGTFSSITNFLDND